MNLGTRLSTSMRLTSMKRMMILPDNSLKLAVAIYSSKILQIKNETLGN